MDIMISILQSPAFRFVRHPRGTNPHVFPFVWHSAETPSARAVATTTHSASRSMMRVCASRLFFPTSLLYATPLSFSELRHPPSSNRYIYSTTFLVLELHFRELSVLHVHLLFANINMPSVTPSYPDAFEGFMIKDHEKWSDFQRQTVCLFQLAPVHKLVLISPHT